MRIFVLLLSLALLIGLDQYSKYWAESFSSYDYCMMEQGWSAMNPAWKEFWGFLPEIACAQNTSADQTNPLLEKNIPIIGDLIMLHLSYNSGIAFSLPIEGIPLKIITIILILLLVSYYIHEEYPKKSRLLDVAYVMLFAWALSHTYERIFVGHVVDFISVKYFAILNLADILISISAVLILLSYVLTHRKHR